MIVRLMLSIFLTLYSTTLCFGQKIEDLFYEITIQSGSGIYGQTSIKFQFEGILLRTFVENKKHTIKRKVEFIPIEYIDYIKVRRVFEYIYKSNLMDLEYEYSPNQYYPVDMKIRVLDMNNGNYVEYRYNTYSQLFDELINLVNDLVPKKFKSTYQIIRIKDGW